MHYVIIYFVQAIGYNIGKINVNKYDFTVLIDLLMFVIQVGHLSMACR